MSDTASISSGIANRYATALFDLVQEGGSIDTLHGDVKTLRAGIDESSDLRDLLTSPLYTREQQEDGINAVAKAMGLSDHLTNTLRLMARKRRMFAVPALADALQARIAEAKGIVSAEVTSAKPLTQTQSDELANVLKSKVGRDVEINTTVDESLIGGLIVKLGSKMIDTSIRSKLAALQNTMKEAR